MRYLMYFDLCDKKRQVYYTDVIIIVLPLFLRKKIFSSFRTILCYFRLEIMTVVFQKENRITADIHNIV